MFRVSWSRTTTELDDEVVEVLQVLQHLRQLVVSRDGRFKFFESLLFLSTLRIELNSLSAYRR